MNNPLEQISVKLKRFYLNRFDNSSIHILSIEKKENEIVLFFKNTVTNSIESAVSTDGFNFFDADHPYTPAHKFLRFPQSQIITQALYEKKPFMYFGNRSIHIAYKQSNYWRKKERPVIDSQNPIELAGVFHRTQGLLIVYYQKVMENDITYYSMHAAMMNKYHPDQIIWKTTKPIWTHKEVWPHKKIKPLGAVFLNGKIITYWSVDKKIIQGVVVSGFFYDPKSLKLHKHIHNPIIAPLEKNNWESFTTFNPAAVYAGNNVHILYRAQGFDYISNVGYARSPDGYSIEKRSNTPIYSPIMDFETNTTGNVNVSLTSGGGYGGCEDPRVTLLGKRIYMTYVAFNGWSSIRLALTSIDLTDFLNERWNWTKPILISRPGIIDKSGCLLPEKINGKYVFFHRVFPNILIDFVDDLSFSNGNFLENQHQIRIRPDKWDSRKIGAGAPPIKTKDGWLLIYYGVDDRDASKYHIGAMLLDLRNPSVVLYRSNEPILEPTEVYENVGFKPGIAYPCGAVVIKNKLFVYYGGADSVVCVAVAELETFLSDLKAQKQIHLDPIQIREVQYSI